jgi:hypothetical protein
MSDMAFEIREIARELERLSTDNATLRAALEAHGKEAAKLMTQRDDLLAAAKNLREVKGRHHSEQAFNRLMAVVSAITNATTN